MTKENLVTNVLSKARYSYYRQSVQEVIDLLILEISDALIRGESVKLSGLGTFEVKLRQGKIGRNPRTREPVPIPPRFVPVWRPCSDLKAAVMEIKKDEKE